MTQKNHTRAHARRRTTHTRVFLIEDHPVMRLGIRQLCERNGITVVGEAATGAEAKAQVRRLAPDVVVIDVRLAGESGLDCIQKIAELVPDARLIIYSMHEDAMFIRRALKSGARGYVSKQEASECLITAVRAVQAGEFFLSPHLSQKFVVSLTVEPGTIPGKDISEREREIIYYLGQGFRPHEIGQQLCLSPKTVETYMGRLKAKLGIPSNPDLVKFSIEHSGEWTLPPVIGEGAATPPPARPKPSSRRGAAPGRTAPVGGSPRRRGGKVPTGTTPEGLSRGHRGGRREMPVARPVKEPTDPKPAIRPSRHGGRRQAAGSRPAKKTSRSRSRSRKV